jgi:hypothetical protein
MNPPGFLSTYRASTASNNVFVGRYVKSMTREKHVMFVFIGIVAEQIRGNTTPLTVPQYALSGQKWVARSHYNTSLHWKSEKMKPMVSMSSPLLQLYLASKIRGSDRPTTDMARTGWAIVKHTTKSIKISTIMDDMFYAENSDMCHHVRYTTPHDVEIMMDRHMYKCWRLFLTDVTPTIRISISQEGYKPDSPNAINAGSWHGCKFTPGEKIVIYNAEYLDWDLFFLLLTQNVPILLFGSVTSSTSGLDVFLEFVLAIHWSYPPVVKYTVIVGGHEHEPLSADRSTYDTEIAFFSADTIDTNTRWGKCMVFSNHVDHLLPDTMATKPEVTKRLKR